MKRKFLIGGIVLAAAAGWLILRERAAVLVSVPPPRTVPEVTLADYDGQEIKLADFRGRAVIINSWASWCPFCRQELKDFSAVADELGEDIVIVAVNRGESVEAARRYSDALGLKDKIIFVLDPDDTWYAAINGFSMPETIFLDREGLIRYHKRGAMERQEIRRRVEDLQTQ